MASFSLQNEDSTVDFSNLFAEIISVDIEDELPRYKRLNSYQTMYFQKHFSKLAESEKRKEAVTMITAILDRKWDSLASADIREYVERILKNLDEDALNKLAENQTLYANKISEKIKGLMDTHAEKEFKNLLISKQIFCRPRYSLPKEISPLKYTKNIPKSLYEAEDYNMNDFEHNVIFHLASIENILWWHRNIPKKGFCINGFINHYPDFLAMTTSGILLAIETKGDDRDNSDSDMKIAIGNAWAAAAGDKYAYFMVFDKKEVDGAFNYEDFFDTVSKL